MNREVPPPRRRGPWVLLLLGALACGIYGIGFRAAPELHPSVTYLALVYPLAVLFAVACLWVWKRPGVRLRWIVGFALAFRLLAMVDPPSLSSDVYRYAWDGRVQRAGFSPYAFPPDAPELAALADSALHPQINRPGARTIYPPGAQVLYRLLPFDLDAVRGAMVAFDLLTILLLARLLAVLGLDPARVVLYAWCPFVVYEVANNGHLEAAMLPLLVGAVLAWHAGRGRIVGVLLGSAVAMKLYPALAFVALGRRRPMRVLAGVIAVPAALYGAYAWTVGADVLGFLPEYVRSAEDHNIGLRAGLQGLLSGVPHARELAFGLCNLGLLGGAAWLWRRGGEPERVLPAAIGLYLLTLPTAFHPWYALWLVPWLCIRPQAAWLWLLAALPLSYLKYATVDGVMPAWVRPVEFVPVFGLLGLAWARQTFGQQQGDRPPAARRADASPPDRSPPAWPAAPPPPNDGTSGPEPGRLGAPDAPGAPA